MRRLFFSLCASAVGCAFALQFPATAIARSNEKETVLYAFKGGSDGACAGGTLIMDKKANIYGTTVGGSCEGNPRGCGTVFKVTPKGIETLLYIFKGEGDGCEPLPGLIQDKDGNLYGTTERAGNIFSNCVPDGCGVVFKVPPNGPETVLYSFNGGSTDGAHPFGGLMMDSSGTLYGTTATGGSTNRCGYKKTQGCGTVFKVAKNRTKTVLYAFKGGSDGAYPAGTLIMDEKGNLYGTTGAGGSTEACGFGLQGCGTVFELSPQKGGGWSETVLYAFKGGASDGGNPAAGLTMDSSDNFYGTTVGGGSANDCGGGGYVDGCGTVFKLASNGTETVLYSFQGGKNGAYPVGGVIADSSGDLYGATAGGGSITNCGMGSYGCGTIFELGANGSETVLFAFKGGSNAAYPMANVFADNKGNLYGSSVRGGAAGDGTVFELKK